ncbi:flagellar export protein FliJ [Roseateles depolymerans]|uniref:Flagellar FliJ protein n=1 Tax=Roseateles depolymerans TaxID=76731 RepID=A0A0U3NCK2_9BURK|nr:flagellar export protein FliJ [Roseateles depolymerans]ALV06208.1 Flagellar export protein FliJ [Roseateles depolymerans]REG19177.1 flagellar FliJ protein [Roseateles depolymerans]
MSSSNLQALTVLLERAEAERDEALRFLQDAERRAQAARLQHDQLSQYRSDYQSRWKQEFAQRTTIQILGCYQNFGGRLDQAIGQQAGVADFADQRLDAARRVLQERELRVASVRKLIERRRAEALRTEMRQEQRATDEQAARAAARGGNPLNRLVA